MARDLNIAILSGVVSNNPTVITTKNNKRICLFDLKTVEKYVLADGRPAQHENFLTIEALGKNVDKCMKEVMRGDRYIVHGYLRVDDVSGIEKVRVRAYYVERE